MKINSYHIDPIVNKIERFIENTPGSLLEQQFNELSNIIFEGNILFYN